MKSAYIHIPFCKNICSYCDFCKMFYNEKLVYNYLDSLENEIISKYRGELLKTLYIGGGTPSCLNLSQLEKLFSITNKFNLDNDYEFTIELNISDITKEKLLLIKENRVNRLSIGIETINDKFFTLINRYNNKKDIIEKIDLCKKYFTNINIDLMYAFPGEVMKELKNDLDFFRKLDVNHISIYSLILEKNTKLYIDKVEPISDVLESNMYYYIIDCLTNIGYNHYEISNFSKVGYESLHNLNYWNNEYYYGFGLGASGYIDDLRYSNTRSINNYILGKYLLESDYIDKKTKMEEELICGLRKTNGISKKRFRDKFECDIRDVFDIDSLINKNELIEEEDKIYIPHDKLYISNNILVNFILD